MGYWKKSDASNYSRKATTDERRQKWADAANKAQEETGLDEEAVKAGNAALASYEDPPKKKRGLRFL